ncbi:helix-turn-helix domain-containing protein [Neobacillus sp. C211]|uniref:helix-turn-helix domain-containing protein n=1 Tax=unclassified Neobacillus TaxID=2675272 RepID=UPI00397DC3B0
MEIGSRLKELRKQKKMTLKEVGDYLSLTGVAVSAYEKGTRKPSPNTIEKLADLYDVSVDDIYGRQSDNSNMRKILNSKTLHWDGEPLREDELNVIRQLLELRIKDKRESRKDLSNNHIG